MSKVINEQSISFEEIHKDLVAFIKTKPDEKSWKDFFAAGAGTVITELIAGLGTFKAYHELMSRRESYRDYALLRSSIFELAFNKGFLTAPIIGAEFKFKIRFEEESMYPISFAKGDLIATIAEYEIYSIEDKTIDVADETLSAVVGYIHTYEKELISSEFTTWVIDTPGQIIVSQLESLTTETGEVVLLKDNTEFNSHSTENYVLRRILDNQVRLYIGNSILGWYSNNVKLTYRCVSYNPNLVTQITAIPKPNTLKFPGLIFSDIELTYSPSERIDEEVVRALSNYYPIDGRIVRNQDYEGVILKFFEGKILDAYSYNDEVTTHQHVYLLINSGFTNEDRLAIRAFIDARRALNIPVIYTIKNVITGSVQRTDTTSAIIATLADDPGVELTFQIYTDAVASVKLLAQAYENEKVNKFVRANTVYDNISICIDLSAKYGVQFSPENAQSFTVPNGSYVRSITLVWT